MKKNYQRKMLLKNIRNKCISMGIPSVYDEERQVSELAGIICLQRNIISDGNEAIRKLEDMLDEKDATVESLSKELDEYVRTRHNMRETIEEKNNIISDYDRIHTAKLDEMAQLKADYEKLIREAIDKLDEAHGNEETDRIRDMLEKGIEKIEES